MSETLIGGLRSYESALAEVFESNLKELRDASRLCFDYSYCGGLSISRAMVMNEFNVQVTFKTIGETSISLLRHKDTNKKISLDWLGYYPCVIEGSRKLIYARFAMYRISFYVVESSISYIYVNDLRYSVSVEFPQFKKAKVNIVVKLCSSSTYGSSTLNFYFDGAKFHLLDAEYSSEDESKFIEGELLKDEANFNGLFSRVFSVQNLNTVAEPIDQVLRRWSYRVYPIELFNQPVFVLSSR